MSRARTLAPMAEPGGCHLADNCPAAGRGRWLKLVDKAGQPHTKHEPNGSFWNRRCPAPGCPIRVHA